MILIIALPKRPTEPKKHDDACAKHRAAPPSLSSRCLLGERPAWRKG